MAPPPDDLDLRAVNWQHGMLLTPDHFLRQEAHLEAVIRWLVRHTTAAVGLVGAGPRATEEDWGAARFDPSFELADDRDAVKVSVLGCRGITPSGSIVDVQPGHPIHGRIPKAALSGRGEVGIWVLVDPGQHEVLAGDVDSFNPDLPAARLPQTRVSVDPSAVEMRQGVLIGQVRPAVGDRYEKVPGFVPPCASMLAHSELTLGWRRLTQRIASLVGRYIALQGAMSEYIELAVSRGIALRDDERVLQFVGRMVTVLDDSLNRCLDPRQSPERFFREIRKSARSAAVALHLSSATRQYYRQLVEAGEAAIGQLLLQEGAELTAPREQALQDDLAVEIAHAETSLERLSRLEEALEGRYLDYRVSQALAALGFFFDRSTFETPALFQAVARPVRPQVFQGSLTFVFSPLRLEAGRKMYRVVLLGSSELDRRAVEAEIRVNESLGGLVEPVLKTVAVDHSRQRNVAIDFDAPDNLATIAQVNVTVSASHPFRECVLYQRRFLQGAAPSYESAPMAAAPVKPLGSSPPASQKLKRLSRYPDEPGDRRGRLESDD